MEVKQAVSQLLDIIKNNEFEEENRELHFDYILNTLYIKQ